MYYVAFEKFRACVKLAGVRSAACFWLWTANLKQQNRLARTWGGGNRA